MYFLGIYWVFGYNTMYDTPCQGQVSSAYNAASSGMGRFLHEPIGTPPLENEGMFTPNNWTFLKRFINVRQTFYKRLHKKS